MGKPEPGRHHQPGARRRRPRRRGDQVLQQRDPLRHHLWIRSDGDQQHDRRDPFQVAGRRQRRLRRIEHDLSERTEPAGRDHELHGAAVLPGSPGRARQLCFGRHLLGLRQLGRWRFQYRPAVAGGGRDVRDGLRHGVREHVRACGSERSAERLDLQRHHLGVAVPDQGAGLEGHPRCPLLWLQVVDDHERGLRCGAAGQ